MKSFTLRPDTVTHTELEFHLIFSSGYGRAAVLVLRRPLVPRGRTVHHAAGKWW